MLVTALGILTLALAHGASAQKVFAHFMVRPVFPGLRPVD